MKNIEDGGPAYPQSQAVGPAGDLHRSDDYPEGTGMSLRDYFAAKALQMIVINDVSGRPENFRDHYSKGAYEWADAMLKAREAQ